MITDPCAIEDEVHGFGGILAADNDSYISTKYPVHSKKVQKSRNLILIQGSFNIISGERDDIITVYVLLQVLVQR